MLRVSLSRFRTFPKISRRIEVLYCLPSCYQLSNVWRPICTLNATLEGVGEVFGVVLIGPLMLHEYYFKRVIKLIFNGVDCQNIFIEVAACMGHLISNQCARVAKSWEFGHLMTVASWAWAPKGRVAQYQRTALVAVSFEVINVNLVKMQGWIVIGGLSSKTRKSLAIVAKVLDGCSGAGVKT